MLSAATGAPSLSLAPGRGTAYSGSKRSELFTDTRVRGSTRVVLTAALRGLAAAVARASAGATTGGLISAAGLASGAGLLSVAVTTFASFATLADATTEVGVGAGAETVDAGSAIAAGGGAATTFAPSGGATATFAAEFFAGRGEGAAEVGAAATDAGGAVGFASIVVDTDVVAGAACSTTSVGCEGALAGVPAGCGA